jgi:pimeloyl-ACP methyl ester carboxylesterase
MTEELHALLGTASESPPYILVGHSLGGMLARVFADRFEGEVVGFVFVDSGHPQQEERLPRPSSAAVKIGEAIMRAGSESGVLRLLPIPRDGILPLEAWRTRRALGPQSVPTMIQEFAAVSDIAVHDFRSWPLGDVPTVVLTASESFRNLPEELRTTADPIRMDLQRELAALSSNSAHRVIPGAGHYIQFDDPDAVVQAVEDVIHAVRAREPLNDRASPQRTTAF